jgi:hypothetical protein
MNLILVSIMCQCNDSNEYVTPEPFSGKDLGYKAPPPGVSPRGGASVATAAGSAARSSVGSPLASVRRFGGLQIGASQLGHGATACALNPLDVLVTCN